MSKPIALIVIALLVASAVYADEKADSTAKPEKTAADGDAKAKNAAASKQDKAAKEEEDPEKVDWSKVNWAKRLNRLQYNIMREAGTERAFTGKYWDFFKEGEYRCAGCGLPLFKSNAKFESECGWPSFDHSIAKDAITEHEDLSYGQRRIEIRCRRCESHLGHVFDDGPTKTGLRYCLNSASMKFVSAKELKSEAKDKKPAATADKPAASEKQPAAATTEPKK